VVTCGRPQWRARPFRCLHALRALCLPIDAKPVSIGCVTKKSEIADRSLPFMAKARRSPLGSPPRRLLKIVAPGGDCGVRVY